MCIRDRHNVAHLEEAQLARISNREVGFVFQSFQLLPRLTAIENVELPLIYAGVHAVQRRKKAAEMLERVGLAQKMEHYPNQLSGGQQQRVAIARAMVTPVSYTHLDVYKRQGELTTGESGSIS